MIVVPDVYQMRRVLRRIADAYPRLVEVSTVPDIDTPQGHRTLFYLEEKELVARGTVSEHPGQPSEMLEVRATAKGIDWLSKGDDRALEDPTSDSPSGLEALRYFLRQSIEASDLQHGAKHIAIDQLLGLSTDGLKALHLRLLQAIAESPEVIVEQIARVSMGPR